MAKPNYNVVLFPFPAHGHITPQLTLAARLHRFHPNLTITLVSTPRNIASIRSSLPPTSPLQLHSLPFCPADHGLITDSESTEDLPTGQFPTFFFAIESIRPAFDHFIAEASKQSTVCIISDMLLGWTLDVARKHHVFHSSFLGTSALGGAVFVSVLMNLPHIHSDSDPFTLPEYPEKSQMMELALGLEASGRPFIWVIRPPLGYNAKDEFKDEWLPDGFEKRMKDENRGFFVHGWAPQIAILSHKSIGAFLSHCGWNSVLESLNSGVPIIGWPLQAEQPFNVTLLVELGVCVEVVRGKLETSEVKKEKVADTVEMVMGDNEKGHNMREKAKEISKMMKRAWKDESCSSAEGIAEFLKLIKRLYNNPIILGYKESNKTHLLTTKESYLLTPLIIFIWRD
ncbi:hypothetical protein LUZ61_015378 [Rhynchospora tenuis]|uniref:Glycosyltransferase n=1 Tax=Rhynchospora tenuis TaxID=198213 RepID=A0AAD5Z3K9_9POAL|nr:hypothetical protein LUZ61_015378 [Rhynchospora tenuis]